MEFWVKPVESWQEYELDKFTDAKVWDVDRIFISHPIDGLFYDEIVSPDRDCRVDKRKLTKNSVTKEVIDSLVFAWNGTVKLFQYDLLRNPCHMDSEARAFLMNKGFETPDLMFDVAIIFVIGIDRTLRAFTVSKDTCEKVNFADKFQGGTVIAKITGNGLDGDGHFFAGANRYHAGEWDPNRSGKITGFKPADNYTDPHSGLLAGYLNKIDIKLDCLNNKHDTMLSLICDTYYSMV